MARILSGTTPCHEHTMRQFTHTDLSPSDPFCLLAERKNSEKLKFSLLINDEIFIMLFNGLVAHKMHAQFHFFFLFNDSAEIVMCFFFSNKYLCCCVWSEEMK